MPVSTRLSRKAGRPRAMASMKSAEGPVGPAAEHRLTVRCITQLAWRIAGPSLKQAAIMLWAQTAQCALG